MGINLFNVCQVLHMKFPSDVESYVQETGRAERDGNLAIATLVELVKKEQGF